MGGLARNVPDRRFLLKYIVKEDAGFVCRLCGKVNQQRGNSMNHVESVHFPNMFEYECQYCGKKATNYNSLQVHISTTHRLEKKVGLGLMELS